MTRDLALRLLREPTARDKQTFIGASSFGSPCSYCIASELKGLKEKGPNRYWLGGVIGTAVHNLLEERAREMLSNVIIEKKIYLGTLEGYGEIYSKPDLVTLDDRRVIDWKTTTKEKLKWLREAKEMDPSPYELSKVTDARFTLTKYLGQIMSYARGLWLAGIEVDVLTLTFICRDGLKDEDIWSVDFDYDPEYADKVWNRLVSIWEYVRDGKDIDEIPSDFRCYSCSVSGRS